MSSKLEPAGVVELGGQRYFELGHTPLEPLPPWRRPGMRRPNESHTEVSSRNESDNPGRLDRPSSETGHDVNETSSRNEVLGDGPGWHNSSVAEKSDWRERLRTPRTGYALGTTQVLLIVAYVAFGLSWGPTNNTLRANLEYASFFVVPFVCLAFLLADLWLLRQPLGRGSAFVVKSGLVLTTVCGGAAVCIAVLFVLADLVFALTGF